jgi:hypothetical protein
MKFYITGIRRGLGEALKNKLNCVNTLEECDVFINCKHDGFSQVEMLYKATKLNKRVINIGSQASDFTYLHKYAVEKKALREANHQLFVEGKKTTCLNFGYFDTERSAHKEVDKMPLEYVIEIIEWVLIQPYRVQELTVCA